jgi:glyoxylase-like metal-dependent hydrolase (beta-lactamase superfamily II)
MTRFELGPNAAVHVHACGEGGIFVNAYLVETANAVVAIDATLTESDSRALRGRLEALGKPLIAVLITHPHPDHVAGITNLVAGDSPRIIATEPVLELMKKLEAPKREQWTPVYGAEWVQRWTYPNEVARSGDRLSFDGVTFSVLDLGAGGDSDANSAWLVESPMRTAFLSDLVFNGTHSYVADGHLLAWLANLTRLERLCDGMQLVFPGHGAPAAPKSLLAAQRDYLLTLAAHVKDLAQGQPALSDAARTELEARMTAQYPEAGLTFLIGLSADAIARELAGPS